MKQYLDTKNNDTAVKKLIFLILALSGLSYTVDKPRTVWLDVSVHGLPDVVNDGKIRIYSIVGPDTSEFKQDNFGLLEGSLKKKSVLYIKMDRILLRVNGIDNYFGGIGIVTFSINLNSGYNGDCFNIYTRIGHVRYHSFQCLNSDEKKPDVHTIIIESPEFNYDEKSKRFVSKNKKVESKLNTVGLPNASK